MIMIRTRSAINFTALLAINRIKGFLVEWEVNVIEHGYPSVQSCSGRLP